MKKLAIVCASLSRGGAERIALYLSKYMVDKGIVTTIVTAVRRENEYELFDGVGRVCLEEQFNSNNKMLKLFLQVKYLHKFLLENQIDTVLIMGVPLCIYAIPGCLGTGTKVVVSERNDPKHFAGKKIVKYISRFFMKKADGFVFQTEDAKKYYDKMLHGRGCVICNPLLVDNFPKRFDSIREKNIVTAGRLNPQKNQKLLIDTFSEIERDYPEYKLIIYGEGILEKELKDYVLSKKLEKKVFFPGNVSDLLEQIKNASVFVMSSDFEGMPNALIEAMALGLPCISTDCPCGGPASLIENGKNGLLVSVRNKRELSSALRTILDNTCFAETLGTSAKAVKEKLSINNIGKQWYEYLNN